MKIRKDTLKRIIKEEFDRMTSEARRDPYFNDYGYQEKDYPDYKEMDRRERGGMGYDEPDEDVMPPEPRPPFVASKSSAAEKPEAPMSDLARKNKEVLAAFDRFDRLDLLPGDFFEVGNRLEVYKKLKAGEATEEEMQGFFK